MRRSIVAFISLVLLCLSVVVSCTSCSEQPVPPEPEQPLRLLWSFAFTQPIVGISTVTLRPALVPNGTIITGLDRQYSSISQTDGRLGWQRALPNDMHESVKRLTYDSQYLYGKVHKDSTYFAIDLQSGEMVWKQTNRQGGFYDYVHDGVDEKYLYLAGKDSVLYVIEKQQGNYVDTIRLQNYARAVISDEASLFISQAWKPEGSDTEYGRIVSLDVITHQQNWAYQTNRGGFYYPDLVLEDGVLYSGTDVPGFFVALDAATGAVKWEHTELQTFRFTMGGGNIFVNDGQYIVALDQENGKELWRQDFTYATTSNVGYLDGYVYHAHNGGLYVMDAQSGQLLAGPISSPDGSGFYNLNAANGRVFVQTDYHLYAYEGYEED